MNRMPVFTVMSALRVFSAGGVLAAEGNPSAGKKKSEDCGDCHGPTGAGDGDTIPPIAGLPVDQFTKAMQDFRTGVRKKSPMMTKQGKKLSDQDVADLAAYYSQLKP